MNRFTISVAIVGICTSISGAFADDKSGVATAPILLAQSGSSCSAWKSICDSRGPGCDAKLAQCLKSGCWTEGPKFGGATHCGLAKK